MTEAHTANDRARALWDHNPHVTPIADDDPGAEIIDCHYPLIHRSNSTPYYLLQQ